MRDFEIALEEDVPRGLPGVAGKMVEAEYLDVRALGGQEWRYRDENGRVVGVVLGYRQDGDRDVGVGVADDRHILTIAGSRTGKGVSLIVPNLLLYDGSVVVIDPKGELARITARARREKGQKVVILDPFNENRRYSGGMFNPLDQLDPDSESVSGDAGQIADALIVANKREPHWTDSARILLKALILFALTLKKEERNLVAVRELLMLTHDKVREVAIGAGVKEEDALFLLMSECKKFKVVAGTGKSFKSMSEKERASIISTARIQTEFLDDGEMQKALRWSDLKLSELKTGKTTLYLCLPAMRMGTHSGWLRVIVNLALAAMESVKAKADIPTLFLLDEFHVLGHMKSIETAAGLMAGFGVKLWIVLQDLSQIKSHYRQSWETFVGNAGVITAWGNTDLTTLKYMTTRMGQTSVRVLQPSGATPGARLSGASATREELRVQRLLMEDEAAQLLAREKDRVLILAAGRKPLLLQRIRYYRDEPFSGLWDSPDLAPGEQ